jgi:hypothetical protein
MPIADYAQNVQTPFFPMARNDFQGIRPLKTAPAAQTASNTAAATKTADSGEKTFWQDVLDIVNPLQHLPIVGTVYRAITGDKMGDVEKVAGDTLYGGPIGLVSSLADIAFEKLTGKDFGDTVLGLFEGNQTTAVAGMTLKPLPPRAIASAPPAQLAAATPAKADAANKPATAAPQAPALTDANTQALMAAMNQNGVDTDLGMRALFAYQKSLGLSPNPEGASAPPP